MEKALPSCAPFHGEEGRLDLVGYAFSGLGDLDTGTLLDLFIDKMTPDFDHFPDGYPEFTDWPNTWKRATHQTQYYRWLERAYRGGLRLLVQHATTNSVLCDLIVGLGVQSVRYACNDMVNVDRIIAETRNLERYIDAQSGGPGEGWFRIVESPAEAREVIADGKLAVVLGIETSNLFDCFLTPPEGFAACDADKVRAELDRYHELGVRVLFPVHKFDNAFSAGDGDRNVGQLGSFVNSGHFSNFVQDCPDSPSVFDNGGVIFGGLNQPREGLRRAGAQRPVRLRREPARRAHALPGPADGAASRGRVLPERGPHPARRDSAARDDEARHDHRGRPPAAALVRARLRAPGRERLPGGRHPRQHQPRPDLPARRRVQARPRPLLRGRPPRRDGRRAARPGGRDRGRMAATRARASAST